MGRVRFVEPEVVQLALSDGDWIEVKKRLSVGEARKATSSFVGTFRPDGSRTPNEEMLGMGLVYAYIVDWSFVDKKDKRKEFSLDALKNIDLGTYREIEAAIDAHIAAMEAEETEQGKKPSGVIA